MAHIQDVYSFSSINTFDQCKYQYYLNYVLPKEERPPNEDNAFSLYGGYVHSLLEKCAKHELACYELCDKYQDEFDIAVNLDFPPNAFCDLRDSYFNDGYAFLERYEGFEDEYEILGIEQNFTEDFGTFKLRGFIDLILRDRKSGEITILDWKSKAKFKNKAEQRHYSYQPALYSKHIKSTYGVWPKTLRFYMFRKGNVVDIPFSQELFDEAVEWAERSIRKIEACDDWEATVDDWFCTQLCNFRKSCPYAPQEDTNDN